MILVKVNANHDSIFSNIEASNAREQVNTLRICIESIDSPGWPPQRPGVRKRG